MGTLPEGRKPLDDDWFNMWPNVDAFSAQLPIRKEKKDENENDTPTTSE